MNMKKLIVTLVVALITFFGYNSLNAQNMKKEEVPQNNILRGNPGWRD